MLMSVGASFRAINLALLVGCGLEIEARYNKYKNILTLARGETAEAKYLTEKETAVIILIVSKTNYKTECKTEQSLLRSL
jgi:hypothetical protein